MYKEFKTKKEMLFMKKLLTILLSLAVLVTMAVPAFAEESNEIKILVNGTQVQFLIKNQ